MVERQEKGSGEAESASEEDSASFDDLISDVALELRRADGTDAELLDILTEHVLTLSPSDNAVANAASAIEALAAKRAEDLNHGYDDYD